MKKKLLLALAIFLLPSIVFAKSYTVSDFPNPGVDEEEVNAFILNPGDTIDFSSVPTSSIYIDKQVLGTCYGSNDTCTSTFEATKSLILEYNAIAYTPNRRVDFLTIDQGAEVISLNDLVEGHIYKSGDIVVFPHYSYMVYYFNEEGNDIKHNYVNLSHKLDKYGNEDITWKLSIVDGAMYAPISLAFQPFSYVKPQFKLTCEKDSINYGEKTSCYVSAISQYQLKEVSFSLDFPSFKVSNVKPANNITETEQSGMYNFRIADGYGNNGTEFKLMTFDLEGTKNENYVDDINITNIQYRDEIYEGSYEVLQSNLKINTKKIENPNTYRNVALILLPILVLIASFGIVQLQKNKKEKS